MPDAIPVIRSIRQEASFDATGRPVAVMRVEFMVGDHGPFIEHFPRAEFSGPNVRAKLAEFARNLASIIQ